MELYSAPPLIHPYDFDRVDAIQVPMMRIVGRQRPPSPPLDLDECFGHDSPRSIIEIQRIEDAPPMLPPPRLPPLFPPPPKKRPRSALDLVDDLLAKRTTLEHLRTERTAMHVGAYGPIERKARVAYYNRKRIRRVWTKKVKYGVRKNFADSRMRVKGRFVKKDDEDHLKDLITIVV